MNINTAMTTASTVKFYVFALMVALVTLPGFAMASGADFDPSVIVTKIVTYTGYGVLILAAFAGGRWALRALGLIGGK